MDIDELISRARESAKIRTREQNIELLRKANIIDEDGYYSARFFSDQTVARDKAEGRPIKL